MNLLGHALGHSLFVKRPFLNIEGYSDIKDIIIRALETDENYNLLVICAPASSKTLFLLCILKAVRYSIVDAVTQTRNKYWL